MVYARDSSRGTHDRFELLPRSCDDLNSSRVETSALRVITAFSDLGNIKGRDLEVDRDTAV